MDALLSYLEIAWVNLAADEIAPKLHGGDSGCTAAHEGVEDGYIFWGRSFDNPAHNISRFRARMAVIVNFIPRCW